MHLQDIQLILLKQIFVRAVNLDLLINNQENVFLIVSNWQVVMIKQIQTPIH